MKIKQTIKSLSMGLLCLSMLLMAGCGGSDEAEPAPTDQPEVSAQNKDNAHKPSATKYTGTNKHDTDASESAPDEGDVYSLSVYMDNDEEELSLDLYSDYTLYLTSVDEEYEGTYYFTEEDDDFYMEIEGVGYEGFLDDDGDLLLWDFDGYFYTVEDLGYTPDSGSADTHSEVYEPDFEITSSCNKNFKNQSDNRTRYYDYNGDLAITYPNWMYNYEDAIYSGSVLISDGNDGYAFCENITDEYDDYDGYDEDFMLEYLNDTVLYVFEELYGPEVEGDYLTLEGATNDFNSICDAYINLYNDDYDMEVKMFCYYGSKDGVLDGNVFMKVFFAPYDDEDQMLTLLDNVKRFGAA